MFSNEEKRLWEALSEDEGNLRSHLRTVETQKRNLASQVFARMLREGKWKLENSWSFEGLVLKPLNETREVVSELVNEALELNYHDNFFLVFQDGTTVQGRVDDGQMAINVSPYNDFNPEEMEKVLPIQEGYENLVALAKESLAGIEDAILTQQQKLNDLKEKRDRIKNL